MARNNASVVVSYCLVRLETPVASLELVGLLGASRKVIERAPRQELQVCVEQTGNSQCRGSPVITAL